MNMKYLCTVGKYEMLMKLHLEFKNHGFPIVWQYIIFSLPLYIKVHCILLSRSVALLRTKENLWASSQCVSTPYQVQAVLERLLAYLL